MSRILVVHGDRGARSFMESRASVHHETKSAKNLAQALKMIATFRPDVLVAGLDAKKGPALDLLRHLRRNGANIPVVVVGAAGAGFLQPMALKLGAASFLEYPMEQSALDRALSKALQKDKDAHGQVPPISKDELQSNLSELEKHLNRHMVCFAGKNQVYLQSLILGNGRPSKPRISLNCRLRKQNGDPPNVYYEYIRDVCCADPSACPAYQHFKARHNV